MLHYKIVIFSYHIKKLKRESNKTAKTVFINKGDYF